MSPVKQRAAGCTSAWKADKSTSRRRILCSILAVRQQIQHEGRASVEAMWTHIGEGRGITLATSTSSGPTWADPSTRDRRAPPPDARRCHAPPTSEARPKSGQTRKSEANVARLGEDHGIAPATSTPRDSERGYDPFIGSTHGDSNSSTASKPPLPQNPCSCPNTLARCSTLDYAHRFPKSTLPDTTSPWRSRPAPIVRVTGALNARPTDGLSRGRSPIRSALTADN